jgi:lipopolysaccharide biosynthesis glycosyltransferase
MMNILMAANEGAAVGVNLVLDTLLTYNKHCNIYIATMTIDLRCDEYGGRMIHAGLNDDQKLFIEKIVTYKDPTSRVVFVDGTDAYMEYLEGNPHEVCGFTPYTGLRLVADVMLPNVDHVLWLDCDLSIHDNIEPMYQDCIHRDVDYSAYICDDACEGKGEMVAGVMVLNLARSRKSGFLERARNNARYNHYRWYDQDAISYTGAPMHKLSADYAYMEDVFALTKLPKIIHYTNNVSPKIYQTDGNYNPEYFYRKYSFLNKFKEELDLINRLDLKVD